MTTKSRDTVFKRRIAALVILFVFLTISSVVPIRQYARGPCRIEPSAVWSLMQPGAGEITAGWERNLLGTYEPRLLMNFDRPDLVEIRLSELLVDGCTVQAGDTLAEIISREVSGRLRVIEAEVEYARAEREALRAGGRIVDLEVARQEIRTAEAQLNAYHTEYERVKALYEEGVAPLSLWQLTQGEFLVLQTELELANARIRALQAGAKPEDIQVAEAEITRLERDLERVSRTLGFTEIITAPVGGLVHIGGIPGSGTVMSIERTDTLVVFAALPEGSVQDLKNGQPMYIRLHGNRNLRLEAPLRSIGFFGGDTTGAYATAFIENREGLLRPGMMGSAKLDRGRHTLFSGLRVMMSKSGGI